jgi:hypothetical protein
MLIVFSKEGQLANRLWQASHFLANAIAYDYTVYHPYFDEYYQYFDESIRENSPKVPIRFIKTGRLLKALLKVAGKAAGVLFWKLNVKRLNLIWAELFLCQGYEFGIKDYDMNNRLFTERARNKALFVWGWLPRDHVHVKAHRQKILQLWQPNANYIREASTVMDSVRSTCNVVIGVHIRRGDYRYFNNGIWYFEDSYYANSMKQIEKMENFRGMSVGFVLCSDDTVCRERFNGLTFRFEQRHVMVDLCLLSMCDYIVGPPSTFSLWAGYFGGKPLLELTNADQVIRYEDFHVPCN